jgi:hypothetical protein
VPTSTPQAALRTSLTQKGDDYVSVGLEGILSSTEKVIGVSRGEVDPDDRDSYEFKTFLRPAELFKDRINLDNGKLLLGAMRKASRSKTLSSWTPGFMDSYMRGMLIGHPLATALEETNPMAIVAQHRRITGFGPGGINSTDAITPSMQNVHASQFGFVTGIDGPECLRDHHQILTATGWIDVSKLTKKDEVVCQVKGEIVYRKPSRIVAEPYKGKLIVCNQKDLKFSFTPGHRCVLPGNVLVEAKDLKDLTYSINFITQNETLLAVRKFREEDFDGMVYCCTVPGGKFLTRGRPGDVGYWTGNSEMAGVDKRMSYGAKWGNDGKLYQKLRDTKTGKLRWVDHVTAARSVVKFPD